MSAARQPKSKLDLLVRVRYQNPIPPPTLPPLLVDIPTPLTRIADPDYMKAYSTMAPHPMMLDSEMGSRVDLNLFEGIWGDDRDQVEALKKLNPKTLHHPSSLHPTDALLLLPASTIQSSASSHNNPTLLTAESLAATAGFGVYNGGAHTGGAMPIGGYSHGGFANKAKVRPEESWLRQTTYISKERSGKGQQGGGMAGMNGMAGLGNREDLPAPTFLHQIQQIEKTFYDHDSFILPGEDPTEGVPAIGAAASGAHERKRVLRHPGKPRVRAVEVFDILPDEEAWELTLTKIDYRERPTGKESAKASDAQLLNSIMRPQAHHVLEHFLPNEENVEKLKALMETDVRVYPEGEERTYADMLWIRDYVNADRNIDPTREILVSFEDGIDKPLASKSSKAEDVVDEDDDDDIFGEKELAQEEQKEEEGEARARKKTRAKGVYWAPVKGRVAAKRKRVLPGYEKHERSTDTDLLRVAFVPQSVDTDWYVHLTSSAREEMSDPSWIDRKLREGEMGGMMETEGEAVGANETGVLERD